MDLETCSLCLTEVPDAELREVTRPNEYIYPGARICKSCRKTHQGITCKKRY